MTTITRGTSHFVSYAAAVRYYSAYEPDAHAAVNRKLDHDGGNGPNKRDAQIYIGPPKLKPGQRLELIDGKTRYAIIETRTP